MRALLVVNPVATTTSTRTRQVLVSALEADLKLEVATTTGRGHAAELATQAREDGIDLLVALGGDGTVNEVVNGLLGSDGPREGLPMLGVVPGGGTNVFARALGLPVDPVEATGALLGHVRSRRSRTVGLGRADGRWFTFNAGMGLDASVVARVDRRRSRGDRPPRPADYIGAALYQFFLSGERRHPALTLTCPGAPPLTGVHLAVVANTAPWTFLGRRPLLMSPDAGFDTGLDVYALTRMGTLGTLAEVGRLLTGRPSERPRHVHRVHDLPEVTLCADRPIAAQVDGEHLGERTSLRLQSVPAALRIVA